MGNNSFELEKALEYLDNNQDESLKRLFEILRIPSISTNNNNKKDCFCFLLKGRSLPFTEINLLFKFIRKGIYQV